MSPDHPGLLPDESGLHRQLARFNAERLKPSGPLARPTAAMTDHQPLIALQIDFVERERARVMADAAVVPDDAARFVDWFAGLREHGPGQHDALFPWLAEEASLADMRWFLTQEAAGEAGFDDLVALSQVKLPVRPKLELARNYWDEMGRGQESGMHGVMLERLVRFLDLQVSIAGTLWPSLALGNLMVALATERQYAYHSLGALGVIELTAPGRVAQVAAGLRRLGVPPAQCGYFEVHAVLDVKHSQGWNREVLAPLVEQDPRTAAWIAEGALMRLHAGARCFGAYRAALGVDHAATVSGR
jgi:hypothetical protein